VEDVAKKVLREKVFYEKSGGGITLSGGEPSLQAPFAMALMEAIRHAGVHVALDTCAGMKWSNLGPVVELADLVLLDLKIMDRDAHLKVLGVPMELVLENAQKIARLGKPIWVRTPIIPGYTDSEDNVRRVAAFIKTHLPTVERYDILAFNKLCSSKYERLGLSWGLETAEQITEEKMELLASAAKAEGLDRVHWSGLTRLEEKED
jgi:pyruvate formate lyase activating enzyme